MGPILVAVTAQLTGDSRFGVFSLVILFIIGLIVLSRVPEPEPHDSVDEVALDS